MKLLQYIPRSVRLRVRALYIAAKCWKMARDIRKLNQRYLLVAPPDRTGEVRVEVVNTDASI